jgi:hypothetical protein
MNTFRNIPWTKRGQENFERIFRKRNQILKILVKELKKNGVEFVCDGVERQGFREFKIKVKTMFRFPLISKIF